ncbi:MAG: beta-galactosidase BgaS [Nitrososphaerota archaeon]|nr:beta-galactosidase BgaS [Candidatus Bathyarchaeota archaeon]MDW8048429.1 beta-galactosidase BgaS [Nitrososphaerota archaeon]
MVFPENFLWGVSLSGFQFEMGDPFRRGLDPNTDWYVWVHDERNIREGIVSGDFPEDGVDYWHRYKADHEMAKGLGLNVFRIGLEWSRIFPKSTHSVDAGLELADDGNACKIEVDERSIEELEKFADNDAVNHYRRIIENLRETGFKVFVCLNHFTLPLWIHNPIVLREKGFRRGPSGWLDRTSIIEFVKYAAYIAWKLGDIVDYWATFNEPMVVSEAGYLTVESGFPPGVRNFRAYRKASVNIALAHARAYDAIKKWDTVKADYESHSPAEVGIIHNLIPVEPFSDNSADASAAKAMDFMHNHYFLRAVTMGPLKFRADSGNKDAKAYMRERMDWLGVNYYTRFVVKGKRSLLARLALGVPSQPELMPGYGFACEPNSTSRGQLPTSDFGWEIYPNGLIEVLRQVRDYGKPIYVTENGVADAKDMLRPKFLLDHLKAVDEAINRDKIDVRGYMHWSLMDNYEWARGFKMRFGLYAVDSKSKERIPRKSAEVYRRIVESGDVEKVNAVCRIIEEKTIF